MALVSKGRWLTEIRVCMDMEFSLHAPAVKMWMTAAMVPSISALTAIANRSSDGFRSAENCPQAAARASDYFSASTGSILLFIGHNAPSNT